MFTVYQLNLQAGYASVAITTSNPTVAGGASGAAVADIAITTSNPTIAGAAVGAATTTISITTVKPTIAIDSVSVATAAITITTSNPTVAGDAAGAATADSSLTTLQPTISLAGSGVATIAGAITTVNPTIAADASTNASLSVAITTTRPTIAIAAMSGGESSVAITLPKPTMSVTASGLARVNISGQNLIPYSEDFTAPWSHSAMTVTPNSIVAPDGSMTASTATYTVGGSQNGVVQSWNGTGSSTGNTFSVYVKQGSGPNDCDTFYLRNQTTSVNVAFGTINYTTGVITGTGASAYAVGNGWYRVILSSTAFSNGDIVRTYIGADSTTTIGNYLYCWGAQLTKGVGEKPYVPTAGVAVNAPVLTTTQPTVAAGAAGAATVDGSITTTKPTISINAIGSSVANITLTLPKPTVAGDIYIPSLVNIQLTAPKPTISAAPSGLAKVDIGTENLVLYSEEFNNAWTHGNITVTPNNTVAPDGNTTASLLTYTATGNNNGVVQNFAGTGSSTGNTFTVYAKKGSGATDCNMFYLRNNTTAVTLVTGTFNYDTGVMTGAGASAYSVGNGWYRIVLSSAGFSNGDTVRPYICADSTGVTGNYAYCWGAQVTSGIGERNYIKTIGSAIRSTMLSAPKPTMAASMTGASVVDAIPTTARPTISVNIKEEMALKIPFTTRRPTISVNIDLAETLNIHLTTPKPAIAIVTEDKSIFTPVLTPQAVTYVSGYPLQIDLTLRDSRGNPLKLGGSTYSCKMSYSSLSTTPITLTPIVVDANAGKIKITTTTQVMSTLKGGRYEYSLMQTTGDGLKNKLAHGILVTDGPFTFVPTTQ